MAKTETWVEVLVPKLELGDPGPIGMDFMRGDKVLGPALRRVDGWKDGRPDPRWWRRIR